MLTNNNPTPHRGIAATLLPTPCLNFEDTVAAVLKKSPPGTVFLAAVSGGADSTAMLLALAALKDRGAAFDLRCIHVEHGIRPPEESRGDAEFVHSLCGQLHVPCSVVSVPQGKIEAFARARGIGIEAAARMFRRRALFKEACRLEGEPHSPIFILTAHTADDMRETALMRILRGSGPSGLAAMPARRGSILRPLLHLNRSDVIAYLTEKKVSWREDSTNTDTQFLRNRVRHSLIPQLNEHFPQWRRAVDSLAQTQSHAAQFIRDEAKRRIVWGVGNRDYLFTNAENFFAQPIIIREEALFQGIDRLLSTIRKARSAKGRLHTIKRANIRRFCESKTTAIDLGMMEIRKNAQQVVISAMAEKDDFSTPHSPLPIFQNLAFRC